MASGIEIDTLTPGIRELPEKLDRQVAAVMEYHEPQVAAYMKVNAPWTDRTTNARNGLDAKAYRRPGGHGIVCFHQVPYGIWLEIANNGRYRIIVPTIINQGREVMQSLRGLLRRMK